MAHIADLMEDNRTEGEHEARIGDSEDRRLMEGLNNYKAHQSSPQTSENPAAWTVTPSQEKAEDTYVWRIHQPSEPRSYHLFPKKDRFSKLAERKPPGPSAIPPLVAGQAERDSSNPRGTFRKKPKEQSLVRRRKFSVPELGRMTTVQELSMDSPTIPGHPPLQERSSSAPANSWNQQDFQDNISSSYISAPVVDANAEILTSDKFEAPYIKRRQDITFGQETSLIPAPLFIPSSVQKHPLQLIQTNFMTQPEIDSPPPEVPPKSPRMKESLSYGKLTPFTPQSASAKTTPPPNGSNFPPTSTPVSTSERSISPWSSKLLGDLSIQGHSRGQSEPASKPVQSLNHRRGESETSIMDRPRPKRKVESSPTEQKPNNKIMATTREQQTPETLPLGYCRDDAPFSLPALEIESLRKQALGQASQFKVLSSKDVEILSRELRSLDERCEYLRKTQLSLRTDRRNLHEKICSYLRSPCAGRFPHETILKQEEKLAGLDASIDNWVTKLEQAENRRMRIGQKLLEHVAVALLIPPSLLPSNETFRSYSAAAEKQLTRFRLGPTGEHTPPTSPTKAQSPPRLANPARFEPPENRGRAESIRIYADLDVNALFADFEEKLGQRAVAQVKRDSSRKTAINAGVFLNAATFTPPKPVRCDATAF